MKIKSDLWPHQKAGLSFALAQGSAGLWFDMRTGKTLTALAFAKAVDAKRILVIAPRVPAKAWDIQIPEHTEDFPAPILLNEGDAARRVARLRDHWNDHGGRFTAILNYEACITPSFRDPLTKTKWDLIVCDEAHRLKGSTSKIGKLFREKMRDNARHRLLLSGTPCPQGYIDYFGVYSSVDLRTFNTKYWTHWKSQFVVCGNPHIPQMVTGFRNTDVLDAVAQKWAVSVKEEDCWPVEQPDEQWLWVDLCSKTRKAYDQLEAQMIAELSTGDVVAQNALVKALRLQQLAGGVAVSEDGTATRLSNEKADELVGFLEDRFEPTVIFAQFLADIDTARAAASRLGRPFFEIRGGVDQEAEFHQSVKDGAMPVIACQIQAASEGIELSDARLAIYLSTGYASARYAQSRARIRGHKQKKRCHYVHIGARGTIDEAVAAALKGKRDFEAAVLERLHVKRLYDVR